MDSENSSFVNYDDLEVPMDDEDLESYLSMEPHEQLLNEEWDYSDDHSPGVLQEHMSDNYPSEDAVIEIADE